jgi:molybdopterin molybdotransferase
MLSVSEALEAVTKHAAQLPPERLPLRAALNCVLAEDVVADLDLPPFDKALVDGYAVRSADFNGDPSRRALRIVEEIPAGRTPTRPLGAGDAASIMTGAPLPDGADAVVMVERTERTGDGLVISPSEDVKAGQNRLPRGREMRAGDVVARRGERLNPARLGLLASVGQAQVLVVPPPRVVIVPTGDELVEPDRAPGPGQIRNSNAVTLLTLAQSAGASAEATSIVRDEFDILSSALARGLAADVLLITGGVSAGNRDLVPAALEELGVTCVFHKVRLKPGKPLLFGLGPPRGEKPSTLVFGLPGNPVSGVVGFLIFVRPALELLEGRRGTGATTPMRGRLTCAFVHRGDRPTYHPSVVGVEGPQSVSITPLDWAGSADLRTVAQADGFAVFPAGDRSYEPGEVVEFVPLS